MNYPGFNGQLKNPVFNTKQGAFIENFDELEKKAKDSAPNFVDVPERHVAKLVTKS